MTREFLGQRPVLKRGLYDGENLPPIRGVMRVVPRCSNQPLLAVFCSHS